MPHGRQQIRRTGKEQDVPCCVALGVCEQPRYRDPADCLDELRRKLNRLMEEHLESLRKQSFLAPDDEQRETDEKRLKDIREISTDYLVAMKRSHSRTEDVSMTDKPSVSLPGRVEKVIKPGAGEPEKAQIAIEGADPLYREIRIENRLKDAEGQEVRLQQDDEVDVTVETDKVSTELQGQEANGKGKAQEEKPRERRAS